MLERAGAVDAVHLLGHDIHPAALVAPGETGIGAAAGHAVEHGDVLGHAQRVLRRQHDAELPDAQTFRLQPDEQVQQHGVVRQFEPLAVEVVLREADRVVTQFVGKPALAEHLAQHGVVILAVQPGVARFHLLPGADAGQVEQAGFHCGPRLAAHCRYRTPHRDGQDARWDISLGLLKCIVRMSVTVPKTPREWHSKVWSLSWPMILANLTLPMVSVVDTAVMGRQPDATYVGAVALGGTIFNAIYWMFGFLRMSSTGLTAQALGAGRIDELAAIAIRAFSAAAALGIMLLTLQWPMRSFMFWLFEASIAVESQAASYFDIRVWSMPAVLLYIVAIGVLFGLQRMGAALLVSMVFNGTNIALDLWFVIGLGWGVDGVAAGTLISEWIAATLGLIVTFRALRKSGWRGTRPPELWNRARLAGLTNVGTNLIVRTFFVQLPFFMLTALSAYLGDLVLAANAVLMQFFHIMAYGLDGFAHTTETLAGHAFGANDARRLRRASVYCSIWAGLFAAAISLAYLFWGTDIVAMLTLLPEVRTVAAEYLPWIAAAPLVAVWAFMLDGVFIGTTRTRELRNSMFLAAAVYLLVVWLSLEPLQNHGIWLSMTVFLAMRSVLLGALYPRIERLAIARAGTPARGTMIRHR